MRKTGSVMTTSPKQELGPNQRAWIAALRSGEYKQGKHALHAIESQTMCCLGVACAIRGLAGVDRGNNIEGIGRVMEYDGFCTEAPDAVKEGLALRSSVGDFAGEYPNNADCLTQANDRGATFKEIADFCEAHPKAVFTKPA